MSRRASIVADALAGGLLRFTSPLAFLYTLVDYLIIGVGVECAIELKLKEHRIVTRKDFGSSRNSGRGEFLGLPVRVLSASKSGSREAITFIKELDERLRLRYASYSEEISRRLLQCEPPVAAVDAPILKKTEVTRIPPEHLEDMSAALEVALREGGTCGNRLPSLPRIQCAIRFSEKNDGRCLFWNYSTGNLDEDEVSTLPKAVLLSAQSGFVAWSKTPDHKEMSFSVPCMLGDVVWAFLHCRCPVPAWNIAYLLYRDAFPRILQHLRSSAKMAYLGSIFRGIDRELGDSTTTDEQLRVRINTHFEQVARCYPFSFPQLESNFDPNRDPHPTALSLRSSPFYLVAAANRFFGSSIAREGSLGTWGDIHDLAPLVVDGIVSRLRLAESETSEMAQDIAHEFKNLTQEISTKAAYLEKRLRSIQDKELAGHVETIAFHALHLNAVSLAMFYFASRRDTLKFSESADGVYTMQAAMRVLLEVRSRNEKRFLVKDELEYDAALEKLYKQYGRWESGVGRRLAAGSAHQERSLSLGDLARSELVSFLLFAVSEPVRNIRAYERPPSGAESIFAWTRVDLERSLVLLFQETIEPKDTKRSELLSAGLARVNRLLPKTFCEVDPMIRPSPGDDNFSPVDPGGQLVRVCRFTTLRVYGLPEGVKQ